MQKVYLDVQPLIKNRTGIGWYTFNTISEILKVNQNDFEFWATCFDLIGKDKSQNTIMNLGFKNHIINKFMSAGLYRQFWGNSILKNEWLFKGGDIYHFFNFIAPPIGDEKKIVVQIYDMVNKIFPDTLKKSNLQLLNKNLERTLIRANHIVTISDSAKTDIVKFFSIEENKISVLPPGLDIDFFKTGLTVSTNKTEIIRKKYNLPNKYFMFLGTLEPRKNLQTVFKAYAGLPNELKKEYKLVICGNIGWQTDQFFNLPKKLGIIDNLIYAGYIEEQDKPFIYALAKVFLFPSLYEGFGMPITESLASGTPVITSNTSSLPEAGGDGVSYVNPLDYHAITEQIIKYVNDRQYTVQMLEKGNKHIGKFSWKLNAIKMLGIYRELITG